MATILLTARELIAERGGAAVKMQDIADRAGMSVGTIYQYFPNKSAIVKKLAKGYIDEMQSTIWRVYASKVKSIPDAVDRSRECMLHYFQMHDRDPAYAEIVLWENVDREIAALNENDDRKYVEYQVRQIRHLAPANTDEDLKRLVVLGMAFTTAAARSAMQTSGEERKKIFADAADMICEAYRRGLLSIAGSAR